VTGYQQSTCSAKLVSQISTKLANRQLHDTELEIDRWKDRQTDVFIRNFSNGKQISLYIKKTNTTIVTHSFLCLFTGATVSA